MKQNTRFRTHSLALTVLFVLGCGIIALPAEGSNEYSFFSFLIAVVLGFFINLAVIPLVDFLFGEEKANSLLFKTLRVIVFSLAAGVCLFEAAQGFSEFLRFISEVLLPKSPISLIASFLLGAVIFFFTRRQEDILKFALLCFWVCLFAVIFFFIASFNNYNFRNIFIFRFPDLKTIFVQLKPYLYKVIFPSLLIPVYIKTVFKKSRPKAALDIALGYIVLACCILSPLLLFGAPVAGELSFPYNEAVSTVSVGRLFTRMDGLAYFIYFAAAIIKINTALFIMYSLLKKINSILK